MAAKALSLTINKLSFLKTRTGQASELEGGESSLLPWEFLRVCHFYFAFILHFIRGLHGWLHYCCGLVRAGLRYLVLHLHFQRSIRAERNG